MGRPPIGARAMTPAEKMRRYRARKFGNKPSVANPSATAVAAFEARIRELEAALAAAIGPLKARMSDLIAKLEGELRRVRKAAAPTDSAAPDVRALQERIRELEAERRREKDRAEFALKRIKEMVNEYRAARTQAAPPKPAKAPLPPDEHRERIIKGLRTQLANVRRELRATRGHYESQGLMPRRTQIMLAKCMHTDTRNSVSAADKDEAAKLFFAWKVANDRAQRKGR
jgi:DNA repair exonuclease SbcCD ATPase subunit